MNKQGFGLYLFICALLICDIAVHCVRAEPSASPTMADLRVHKLTLVNTKGIATADLFNGPDGAPVLTMFDQKGHPRFLITAGNEGAGLSIRNSHGQRDIQLGAGDTGAQPAEFTLYDKDKPNVDLHSGINGNSGLVVLDDQGATRASVAYYPADGNSNIAVHDSTKSAELNCDHDAAVVSTDDQKINRRCMLIYTPAVDASMVVVNDKDKKPIWSAPIAPPAQSNTQAR